MLNTPLHPILVHFPVAFLIVGTIMEVIALWKPKFFDPVAFFLIAVGEVMGIFAYLTGDGAEHFAENNGKHIEAMVHIHQTYATLTLITFGLLLLVRLIVYFWTRFPLFKTIMFILAIVGGFFITMTGYYGGEMSYKNPSNQLSHHKDGERTVPATVLFNSSLILENPDSCLKNLPKPALCPDRAHHVTHEVFSQSLHNRFPHHPFQNL